MKFSREHNYSHGTDTLYALFTDAEEIEAKQEALGARNIRVLECDHDADSASVCFVRELPADVPAILSSFLQPWNTVTQSEQWRSCGGGVFKADLAIDVANVPVTVRGTLELKPEAGGCVNHVRMVIDSGIPFVGKTLAEFAATDCKRLVALEYEYITERLGSG